MSCLFAKDFADAVWDLALSIQTTTPASVTEAFDFAPGALRSPFDFDGDGRTDISVYRPSEGNWYLQRSTQGFAALNWGIATDKLVPADYDNDGKTDLAVFRKGENSTWYILNSANSTVRVAQWGASNIEQAILFDTPVPADYDGDGKTDLAVWRLTDFISEPARYLIQQSSNGQPSVAQWGSTGDIPVPADFDGDRRTDLAIYRGAAPSGAQWWVQKSLSGQVHVTQFGLGTDKAVPADYTGDAIADIAVWRPATGEWFILARPKQHLLRLPVWHERRSPRPRRLRRRRSCRRGHIPPVKLDVVRPTLNRRYPHPAIRSHRRRASA